MSRNYKPYRVIGGEEHLVTDENEQIFGGEWQQKFLEEPENMITIGHHHDPMRGPQQPSQYTVDSLYRHLLITGMTTGYGTSTLVRNIQLQLIERGYGMSFIDPRGNDSLEILKSIPEHRLDDVVWIEPRSEKDKFIGFNSFNLYSEKGDENYDEEVDMKAKSFVSMIKDYSEYWGPQLDNITESLVRELIRAEESFNPIDFIKIIKDKEERKLFAENYGSGLENEFMKQIAEQDTDVFEPTIRRLREWVSDRDTRTFCASESHFDLVEAINSNKIIILNTSNISSSSTETILTRLFIDHLWNAVRISKSSTSKDAGHFLFINNCNSIEDSLSNICQLISQARSFKLGVIPIVQRLNDLDPNIKTCLRQTDNTITLNVGTDPSTTGTVAQLFNISAKEISELEHFEAISKVMSKSGYKSDNTVSINLFVDFQYRRDNVDNIIESSIDTYGSKIETDIQLDQYGIKNKLD